MELATLIAAGWTSGINAYLTVLLLGLAGRLGWADTPAALQTNRVLIAAAVLFAVEFVVDKVPLADSAWDVLHTAVRPAVAAATGAALAGASLGRPQAALLAAALALVAHGTKASTRVAINASPEPFTNVVASFTEDGVVTAVLALALTRPYVAAGVTLVAMVAGVVVAVLAWSLARRGYRRVRSRWARGAGAISG